MLKLSLRHHPTSAFLLLSVFILFVGLLPLHADPKVVISQVYGGGGNSGATWKNDFIELFNAGNMPQDLTGWTVQYASSAGSSWSRTTLTGSVAPGQYYLVQEAAGAGGTTPLPAPNAIGTLSLSSSSGKVALVNNGTALTGTCPSGTSVVDFVGFGGANCYQGSGPTATLSNTTAAVRLAAGCALTAINSADFAADDPTPRNSSSPITVCSTGTASPSALALGQQTLLMVSGPAGMVVSTISADLASIAGTGPQPLFDDGTHGDAVAGDNVFSATVQVGQCSAAGARVIPVAIAYAGGINGAAAIAVTVSAPSMANLSLSQIQGAGSRSPYECLPVTTTGVVTLVKKDGFYLQDPVGDGDPATSDGVYVYTKSAPGAAAVAGNSLTVSGTVQEYVPSGDPNSPPLTEIVGPTLTLLSSGNALPPPVNIGSLDANGSLEQLERYEGMRVHVDALTVTGPTLGTVSEPSATASSNGLFFGVLPGTPRPFREAGIEAPDPIPNPPCCIPRFDGNPERLRVDTGALPIPLEVTSGAAVSNITGPLDYGYRTYSIVAEPGITATGNLSAVPIPAPDAGEFTVASMNLQHFYDTIAGPGSDSTLTAAAFANRLNKVSLAIRNILQTPDIVGVEEMENLATLQALADKLNADAVASGAPAPNYQPYLYDGNDISGINVGLLVKPRIQVNSVTQYGKSDTLPGTSQIMNDRPPIVLDASVANQGETQRFYVIVNHLRSLSGVEDPSSIAQPKRKAQAEYLAQLIQSLQGGDGSGGIVSIGDYNAYQVNDGYVDVMGTIRGQPAPADQVALATADYVDPDLTDLLTLLDPQQRYSYVYDGTGQVLDHVLVNPAMLSQVTRFSYARNNADFPESYRNDPNRPERYADHDIAVAYFKLPVDHTPPVLTLPGPMTVEATSPAGAAVSYAASANDSWDGATPVACAPPSGSTFPLGNTVVSCSSSDAHHNTATGSFTIAVVDTTPPLVSLTGVSDGATYLLGGVPKAGCSTTDTVSPIAVPAALQVTGGTANGVGHFVATCSGGQDAAGNVAPAVTAGYTVVYGFTGFLPPLDTARSFKAGSTIPLKWQLSDAGGHPITALSAVQGIQLAPTAACYSAGDAEPISGSGSTELRYAGNQFLFNWQTSSAPGCYNLAITLDDATSHSVSVNLK